MTAYKIPQSVLVVIHTPALDVLLIRRADASEFWQSVTGSKDSLQEPAAQTAARAAQEHGLGIMVGCMLATSLAMAPAFLLAPFAEVIDLDGPLLLKEDRSPAIRFDGSLMHPAPTDLWG